MSKVKTLEEGLNELEEAYTAMNKRLNRMRIAAGVAIGLLIAVVLLMSVDALAYQGAYYPEHGVTVPPVSAPYQPSAMDFIGAPNGGWK